MAFAPALSLAKKLMRSNVDALVIEGMEAGGHIGDIDHPLPTLVDEVRAASSLPSATMTIPLCCE